MRALLDDAEVLRYTRIPEPVPAGFAETWLARYEDGRRDGTCAGFAAIAGDGSFLGLALAPAIDEGAAEVELGYIVARDARGRGVGGELLRQLTAWARAAQRIVLIIDVENGASSRLAARGCYMLEGVLRSLHIKQGTRRDAELWSLLPSDADRQVA